MELGLIKYKDMNDNEIELSPSIIRQYLCPGNEGKPSSVTDPEIMMFMKLCQHQNLNPFLREVYLIKYGTQKATMVTGIETFLKRASHNQKYRGHEVTCEGQVPNMTATCKVYVDGYTIPISATVDYEEYVGQKDEYIDNRKTGNKIVNSMWQSKPRTMLKKVAEAQALRKAFPDDFAGMYSSEEINTIQPEDIERTIENLKPRPTGVTVCSGTQEPVIAPEMPVGGQALDIKAEAVEMFDGTPVDDNLKPIVLATDKQLKCIFAIMKQIDMTPLQMKDYCKETFGVESSKELTSKSASDLIGYLKTLEAA